MATALFANILLNSELKLNEFKLSFSGMVGIFSEYHINVRGDFRDDALAFVCELNLPDLFVYQDLSGSDWIFDSLIMAQNIKSNSVYFFLEDHYTAVDKAKIDLVNIFSEFEDLDCDCMTYSWYRAKAYDARNFTPIVTHSTKLLSVFEINKENISYIKTEIGFNKSMISMAAMFSRQYFLKILNYENVQHKLYLKLFSDAIWRIFGFPRYLFLLKLLNAFLFQFSCKINFYSKNTPFNFEKLFGEFVPARDFGHRIAVSKVELMANFDDDNGCYGESLIKRGHLGGYDKIVNNSDFENVVTGKVFTKELKRYEFIDLTFVPCASRQYRLPMLRVDVVNGSLDVTVGNTDSFTIGQGQHCVIPSNLDVGVIAAVPSSLKVSYFDL